MIFREKGPSTLGRNATNLSNVTPGLRKAPDGKVCICMHYTKVALSDSNLPCYRLQALECWCMWIHYELHPHSAIASAILSALNLHETRKSFAHVEISNYLLNLKFCRIPKFVYTESRIPSTPCRREEAKEDQIQEKNTFHHSQQTPF